MDDLREPPGLGQALGEPGAEPQPVILLAQQQRASITGYPFRIESDFNGLLELLEGQRRLCFRLLHRLVGLLGLRSCAISVLYTNKPVMNSPVHELSGLGA